MWALACFGGESTQQPTVKIVLVSPAPRVASHDRLDISRVSRSSHCSPFCSRQLRTKAFLGESETKVWVDVVRQRRRRVNECGAGGE
jgi:hypothetical protein